MSEADQAQLRHDRAAALRARLELVDNGKATADDYHRLAVELSELAESARRIGGPAWWEQTRILLSDAEKHFLAAREMTAPTDTLPHCAITCDYAVMRARRSWLQQSRTQGAMYVDGAARSLAQAIKLLEAHKNAPSLKHQLAIAYGFAARLAWGDALGFTARAEGLLAAGYSTTALHYFASENPSPDDKKAFRSHLLTMALAHDTMGNAKERRSLAALALRFARAANDIAHARRARLIWWFGNLGECWLRRRRDKKLIEWYMARP